MIELLRSRLRSSFRLRLTLGYVAVLAVLAVAWLASLFGPLTGAIKAQQQAHLATIARSYALALEYAAGSPQDFVERVAAPDLHVSVVAADGRVLGDNREPVASIPNQTGLPEVRAALDGQVGYDVRRSRTGEEHMYVAVPARYGGGPSAIRVSESLASVGALAAETRSAGLLGLALAIAVALFVTARLSSDAVAPIKRLTSAANAIAAGDLQQRVTRETGDLEVLSDALADLVRQVRARTRASEREQSNLRTVLDGLDDGVMLIDGDVVRLANGAMSQLFKMPFGGWRDRPLSRSGLPPTLLAAIRRSGDTGRTVQDIGPDPMGRTIRVTVVPVGIIEGAFRTLVVISDVSERARLDAVRRDFVANASHELKTPAAAIQLLAESAASAASDGEAEQALAFVAQMRAEADKLRTLVLDLLDLSRLEQTGRGEAVTDVREAIDLALSGHRPAAEAKSLVIGRDLRAVEDEDVYVAVEPTDVAVAFDNLLSNAINYTEAGGVVVRVSLSGDSIVAIEVSDTGVGIPADALPRVFERFFRVDKGRSRDSGGTGLGLSLVRHVVERNGGDVSIASEVGVGTTVTLLLPRAV